jgi:hypothetical protein
MFFCDFNLGSYTVEVMVLVVLLQKVRCVQLIFRFPSVVGFWISLPLKEILKFFCSSRSSDDF